MRKRKVYRRTTETKRRIKTILQWWVQIQNICKNTCIMKTYLYNFDPLKPHFYIVKLGFTGVYIFFLFLLQNIDCGYPQSMFWAEIKKNIRFFLRKLSGFLAITFSIYLNRRVFVMILGKQYFIWNQIHRLHGAEALTYRVYPKCWDSFT